MSAKESKQLRRMFHYIGKVLAGHTKEGYYHSFVVTSIQEPMDGTEDTNIHVDAFINDNSSLSGDEYNQLTNALYDVTKKTTNGLRVSLDDIPDPKTYN